MRRVWVMVRKDLRRQWRSPMAVSIVLAFPLVFAGLLALTFGTGGDGGGFPKVRMLVEDRDDSMISGFLVSSTENEQLAKYFDVTLVGEEGQSLIEKGEASALLRIPKGFGDDLLAGTPLALELVRNPAESIMPDIAEQGLTVLADLLDSASHVMRGPLSSVHEMMNGDPAGPSADEVAAMAVAVHGIVGRAEALVIPPAIVLDSLQLSDEPAGEAEETSGGSSPIAMVFLVVLPGISVWALFLLGDMAMRDVLTESRLGTLRRQLVGPIHAWEVVVGKTVYTAVMATVSLILLAGIGWVIADRTVAPLGFIVLSAAVIVAVTGYAAAVYGLARTERQGGTLSSILLLAFAFMGGAFLPLENLPASVQRIAPVSPFYWGTRGYQELILNDAGLLDVLTNVGVLAGLGAVMLALGSWLLGRKVQGGLQS